ncbi:MAG TPA: hypothetical protein PK228_19860 [Saprospiraceae bacterium]|nr:hypothetical protein [Saprospiraceae bacterium]
MIDTDVETGAFFPPELTIIDMGGDFKFLYPISAQIAIDYIFRDIRPRQRKPYDIQQDSDFVRQVKIKLGIVAADAYF